MHWIAPSEELHHNDIRCFGVSGSDAFDLPRVPERERSNHWQAADIPSWAFQFAHFIPSKRSDGWGCSNGPELDVAPPRRGAYTPLGSTWSIGADMELLETDSHGHVQREWKTVQALFFLPVLRRRKRQNSEEVKGLGPLVRASNQKQ